tara:strand:- start:234 stop:572 length:339 start_codon:yes stop_codon:yes gene_type:complete
MKKLILLLFIPLVFQGCFSYKTVNYSQIANDKKQRIIVETIDKVNIKGKLVSIDEEQIALKKSGKLKTVNKENIRDLRVRKFSISKTAGGIIGGYGTIVFILPVVVVLAAFI